MSDSVSSRKKPADHITELRDLVVGYAKQETIEPLSNLQRYLTWGIAGAVAMAGGCFFLLLALLRGLQSIDGIEGNTGFLSLIPYGATVVAGGLVIVAAVMAITKGGETGGRK